MIQHNKQHSKSDFAWIWNLECAPKVKDFLWRVTKNGLPTLVKLAQRGIGLPTNCPSCDMNHEDLEHLHFRCQITKSTMWLLSPRIAKLVDKAYNTTTTIAESLQQLRQALNCLQFSTLSVAWWTLWYFRNKKAFDTSKPNQNQIG